jgi:hypothetical protein
MTLSDIDGTYYSTCNLLCGMDIQRGPVILETVDRRYVFILENKNSFFFIKYIFPKKIDYFVITVVIKVKTSVLLLSKESYKGTVKEN